MASNSLFLVLTVQVAFVAVMGGLFTYSRRMSRYVCVGVVQMGFYGLALCNQNVLNAIYLGKAPVHHGIASNSRCIRVRTVLVCLVT